MATIEEILGKCSVVELRDAADGNGVSRKGAKAELVSRLASSVPLKKALEYMSKDQIQEVLAKYERPRSGNKDELIGRVLALVRAPRKETQKLPTATAKTKVEEATPETSYQRGHDFEDAVAAWAKKEFIDLSPLVTIRDHVLAADKKRPYEVDVRVHMRRKGLFAKTGDMWIECKSRAKSSIKYETIMNLIGKAQDVNRANKAGKEEACFFLLAVASNQPFEQDALRYATAQGVWCLRFQGRKCIEENEPKNAKNPAWLT